MSAIGCGNLKTQGWCDKSRWYHQLTQLVESYFISVDWQSRSGNQFIIGSNTVDQIQLKKKPNQPIASIQIIQITIIPPTLKLT